MKSRLIAAAAIGTAALATVAAFSSSGTSNPSVGSTSTSGGSSANNAPVTLTLFGADYGSGPSNTTTKFWQAAATAFHAAQPNITVNLTTPNRPDLPAKSEALIQNHQYPDIMEGNAPQGYAQGGIIYPL